MPYHESIRKEPPRRPLISFSVGHLLLGVRPTFKSRPFLPEKTFETQQNRHTYELTETAAVCTGPAEICIRWGS